MSFCNLLEIENIRFNYFPCMGWSKINRPRQLALGGVDIRVEGKLSMVGLPPGGQTVQLAR